MFKFVDHFVSDKLAPSQKAAADKDATPKRGEHKRANSAGKRSSVFSSKADGLLFLPGDHIPPEVPGQEGEITASRRSSTSIVDLKLNNERPESRTSNSKGRKLMRLSRKSVPVKPLSTASYTDISSSAPVPRVSTEILERSRTFDNGVSPAVQESRVISQPYDFLHVQHTRRDDLVDTNRQSEYELATEFPSPSPARSQQPRKELTGVRAQTLHAGGYASDAQRPRSRRQELEEPVSIAAPLRPRRSDELLAETSPIHTQIHGKLRHARSAETIERVPSLSHVALKPASMQLRQASRYGGVDGPTVKNLGGLGARQPTGAPQLPPNVTTNAPADPRWSIFATTGFNAPPRTMPQAGALSPQPSMMHPYVDDPLLTPNYGKELERVPEEDEESRSQRTSRLLPGPDHRPMSSSSARPPLPMRSPSRSSKVVLPAEPARRGFQSPRQPLSRVNSNASDTLAGFIHRPLGTRKSTSSVLSTATGRSRGARRGGTDSIAWEDEIDFAYEHHMEAHCDLDWANTSKRETSTSVETVPELDHSNTSSARSTQDGSLLPPSSMGIDVLATVNEALSSPDLSSSDEKFKRRKPQVRDLGRESYLYDDGRPDLGLPASPSDLDEARLTMSATTVSSSEVTTPAESGGAFKFPIRKPANADAMPAPVEEQDEMYAEVLASYEKATRPSLDAVVEVSSCDEAPDVPRKQPVVDVAESRPFQRASLMVPLPSSPGRHQKSASTGTVTDFAVATLQARLHRVSQSEDDGVTPRQSSRLSSSNLKLHTMVSTLRTEASEPSTAGSELTDEPASLASSQVSLAQQDEQVSMAPSSTASDDLYQMMLPPAPLEAPPIPQRSRSRPNKSSALASPLTTPGTEEPVPTMHRRLHSASSVNKVSPPPSHIAYFSARSDSLGPTSQTTVRTPEWSTVPQSPMDKKSLPPLPSPPLLRTRSARRAPGESSIAPGMASVATPVVIRRSLSKGSATNMIASANVDRSQARPVTPKIDRPLHRRASSRTPQASGKYKAVRHYCYGFDVVDDAPGKAANGPKTRSTRPITQFNLPSQEILALGGDPQPQRPTTAGRDFVAKQYSDMSPDEPAPTMSGSSAPSHFKSPSFSLFPASAAKQKLRTKNLTEGFRLDRVMTALQ